MAPARAAEPVATAPPGPVDCGIIAGTGAFLVDNVESWAGRHVAEGRTHLVIGFPGSGAAPLVCAW
jgi:hypothetical protein